MIESKQRALPASRSGQRAGVIRNDISLLTADDVYLFNQGTHYHLTRELTTTSMKSWHRTASTCRA
jgi:hypothetical protein